MEGKDLIIMLDPGHGMDVAGKRSPDGKLRECVWARQTMAKLANELNALGIETYDTTEGDINEPGLAKRCQRANAKAKKSKKKCAFVSIHCNAAGSGKNWLNARGWECYSTRGQNNSDKLAECMYDFAKVEFDGMTIRKDKSDGDSDKEANFYVIKNANMPAVLVENFFQDNKKDVEFLLSQEGRKKCVDVMKNGILRYFGIE